MASFQSSSSASTGAGYIDQDVIRKTQAALDGVITRPVLTPKLLSRPPFKFIHDVFTSVIAATGFGSSLYQGRELDREMSGREAKIAFIKKMVDLVELTIGIRVTLRPARLVAGLDPVETNTFLQQLAAAATSTKYVENVAATKTILGQDLELSDNDVLVTSSLGLSSIPSPSRTATSSRQGTGPRAASSPHHSPSSRTTGRGTTSHAIPSSPTRRSDDIGHSSLRTPKGSAQVDSSSIQDRYRSHGHTSERRSPKHAGHHSPATSSPSHRHTTPSQRTNNPRNNDSSTFGARSGRTSASASRDSRYRSIADISKDAGDKAPTTQTYKDGWWECRVARGGDKCARLLKRQLNVEVSKTNHEGWTPLHLAAKADHPECITELIFRGTYVNVPDNIGRTPLHIAAQFGSMKAMSELISNGAMLDAVNSYGDTPLHLACRYGKADAVRELIGEGAEIFTRNNNNQNPHDCASANTVNIMKTSVMFRHAELNQLIFDQSGVDTEGELARAEANATRGRGGSRGGRRAPNAWIPAGHIHSPVTHVFDIPLQ